MSLHVTWRLTLCQANTHSCKHKQEDVIQRMTEVYFSAFFKWVISRMLSAFALKSSVLMLLNISLSNSVRNQSEAALREETVQNAAEEGKQRTTTQQNKPQENPHAAKT